ncbi:MAG: hypothetical protein V3S10_03585 [Dehalococcoidales bacterium]
MRLYHVSDRPGIVRFEPRLSASAATRHHGSVVWAVDEAHLHNYLLPRDCPRVTFHATSQSRPGDVERLVGSDGGYVVAIEAARLPEVRRQRLHLYEFPPDGFTTLDASAGYYVSHRAVKPLSETVIDDLPAALRQRDVDLRVMPSLWELREAVIASTLQFSIIRMRNALPPPEGLAAYHPLP